MHALHLGLSSSAAKWPKPVPSPWHPLEEVDESVLLVEVLGRGNFGRHTPGIFGPA